MIELKAYGMSVDDWGTAHRLAKRFMEDYPDRMGIRDCVVYSADGCKTMMVYRTKQFIVVRGVD